MERMMSDNPVSLRAQYFTRHWQLWASLHHFLSAPLLRELLVVIVEQVSSRSLAFGDLFDDAVSASHAEMATWLLRLRDVNDELSSYLQRRIHSILWQQDTTCYVPTDHALAKQLEAANALETALQFGVFDFSVLRLQWRNVQAQLPTAGLQESFSFFKDALIEAGQKLSSALEGPAVASFDILLKAIPAPLDSVVAKHLGDLYADIDDWVGSTQLYKQAAHRIQKPLSGWSGLRVSLRPLIVQSQASALRRLRGAESAETRLSSLQKVAARRNPLLVANASFDARSFYHQASESIRPAPAHYTFALLPPPLLLGSQDLSAPLRSWLDGDRREASVHFWAVLRRQIALGSTMETRTTKALYARSLVDRLEDQNVEQCSEDEFYLAVRLLIESGDLKAAKAIRWHESLVNRFVNEALLEAIEQCASRYEADSRGRRSVLVPLFSSWCFLLPSEKVGLAQPMLSSLVQIVRAGEASSMGFRNAAIEGLEALTVIAKRRPELRSFASAEVTEAMVAMLNDRSYWNLHPAALDASIAFCDALNEQQLRSLVNCVLALADQLSEKSQNWLLLGATLRFLISRPVKMLSQANSSFGRRIVATILRFGAQEGVEGPRILFYLHDFDSALLRDESVAKSLVEPIADLRRRVHQINSSNVSEHILALLIAPQISGQDGVKDAVDSLRDLLGAALAPKAMTIGLPNAYQPILQLATNRAQTARELNLSSQTFDSWIRPLLPLVASLWERAENQPSLFAPFRIPPTDLPNAVVVHNWVYASLALATTLDYKSEMLSALDRAANNLSLVSAITLGKSTRSLNPSDPEPVNIGSIQAEGRQTYYDNLGRRLAYLQLLDGEQKREFCKTLLTLCFRHGPRAIDAAVILEAIRCNLLQPIADGEERHYMRRLDSDRETKLAIEPLLSPYISN
jgi:hypothetical protein